MNEKMRAVNSRYLNMWDSNIIYLNSSIPIDNYFISPKFKDISFLKILKRALTKNVDSGFVFIFDLTQKKQIFKFIIFIFLYFLFTSNALFLIVGKNRLTGKLSQFLNFSIRNKQITELHKYRENQDIITLNMILHLRNRLRDFNVLAFIPHRNDFDSLCLVIDHLLLNNINVHIIDDHSDEVIIEKIKSTFIGNPKIEITFLPYSSFYNWTHILDLIDNISSKSKADMIIRSDSDEFLFSSIQDLSLKEFLLCIYSSNFRYVDATVINLYSTFGDYTSPIDATHFSFGKEFSYQKVLRAWKREETPIGLSEFGGHFIQGKEELYFPMALTLLHASLRSYDQARKKVEDRNLRGRLELDQKGWHSHYKDKSVNELLKVPHESYENNSDFFKNYQLECKYKLNLQFDQF